MIRYMLSWKKARWLLIILFFIAFRAYSTHSVAGTSSSRRDTGISLLQEVSVPRLTPEFLKANGFREIGGTFRHDRMPLSDAANLLGFSIRDLKEPYSDCPGYLKAHVDLDGIRCYVRYDRENIDFRDGKHLVWVGVSFPSLQAAEDDLLDADAPPPRVTAELLEANGFRKDNHGDYTREKIKFQELKSLLEFSEGNMGRIYYFNMAPGVVEFRVEFYGGSGLLRMATDDTNSHAIGGGNSILCSWPRPNTPIEASISLKAQAGKGVRAGKAARAGAGKEGHAGTGQPVNYER